MVLKSFLMLGSACVALCGSAAHAAEPAMNQVVHAALMPQLEDLFERLNRERSQMRLDGVQVFASGDKFLPGKIALGLSDLIEGQGPGERLQHELQGFRDIADLTVGMDNHTWGIYYYLLALRKLQQAGQLEQAVSAPTLARLKQQLDWRHFVRTQDLTLIQLPTNYYGVAFGVARLRYLLGWEDETGSRRLLDKMLEHYRRYSGAYGFSDETDGEGRFDRYSILLVAEICERFTETGLPVTDELKSMLRKSVDIALTMANPRGDGFSYGRSLGPYGDTAALEILAVAAQLKVLSAEEAPYAYAYATRIVRKYADFWFNPTLHSVDMWTQGRRTDAYRAEHRILGENFSLLHQLFAANARWNEAGFRDATPPADLKAWVDKTQAKFKMVWFAKGEYERALVMLRDGDTLFSLPLINGGREQHANSPYYPLPFAQGLVAGTPDSGPAEPQLLPSFELADGSQLIGTSFIRRIETREDGAAHEISYQQDALSRQGLNTPVKDTRITLETRYRFEPGRVIRSDRYTPSAPLRVRRLSLDFASFSAQARVEGLTVDFGQGRVQRFAVSGLDRCDARPSAGAKADQSPEGPMLTHVSCQKLDFEFHEPLTVTWTLSYH
jgi:hypothetical protein